MPKKEELETYLREEVHPLLEALVTQLLIKTPKGKHLPQFCLEWLQSLIQKGGSSRVEATFETSEDDMNEQEERKFAEKMAKKRCSKEIKVRAAVSAEVYGQYNKKQEFHPRSIPKSEDVKMRILTRLKQSFVFSNLDDKETDIVIDAMEEKKFGPSQTVIKQGQNGDCLYVVDQGQLDCFKSSSSETGPVKLKTYIPGQAFGELALLYNVPRAATIKSNGTSVLFALDRQTFNNIVKDSAEKKRKAYQRVLTKVQLLKGMDPYQRSQICDVLKEIRVNTGDYIIREGDFGDKFYIVNEGKFAATKKNSDGSQKTVLSYKEGEYFGELALLKDIPRQASVKALTSGKLMYVERDAFKRMLGSVEGILERNSETYKKLASI